MAEKEYKYASWNNGDSASLVRDRIEECFQELSNKIGSGSGGSGEVVENKDVIKHAQISVKAGNWKESEDSSGLYEYNLKSYTTTITNNNKVMFTIPIFKIKPYHTICSDIKPEENITVEVFYK